MTHSINPTRSSAALFTICVRCLMPLFFPLICIQFFELGASFRYIFEKKKNLLSVNKHQLSIPIFLHSKINILVIIVDVMEIFFKGKRFGMESTSSKNCCQTFHGCSVVDIAVSS